ncbi:MAG: LacI family DNA-binding transcriptional regulator [Oscillospiraceae bacterium]|nr:LacI family DNA-binding transcriptional regulator [Oscillospiraceae bacterium]
MTIKDLAAKTGYAVGTVSRALNDHPNVSEKARKIILEAASESGFQLNVNAKQLKQQYSNTILVVVKGIRNELFAEMVETIQSLVSKTRYQLAVDYMDEDLNEVIRAVQLCREKKPLGILFLGGNHQHFEKDFEKIDVPCVLVTNDASALGFSNLSSVSNDAREAGRYAVEMLIGMGHKNIAIIGGDREVSDTSRLRYEGCLAAMKAHGLTFDPQKDYRGVRFSYQDGYHATRELLAEDRKFTAIFAAADVMAIGAIRALWENGLRVPEDVSVMGVDGLPMGTYMVPQLTTVRQPVPLMALRSVEILLQNIEGNAAAVHETIPFEIYRRESVRNVE